MGQEDKLNKVFEEVKSRKVYRAPNETALEFVDRISEGVTADEKIKICRHFLSVADQEGVRSVHLRLQYFVLKPHGDSTEARASRAAIGTYASLICDETLAGHLRAWVSAETREAEKGHK